MEYSHQPVLLAEVLDLLQPARRRTVVDCTLGGGGHSAAVAEMLPAGSWLVGIDRDVDALEAARQRLPADKAHLVQGNFSSVSDLLATWDLPIDGFLFDLGVSSWQLDNLQRGFSYQDDAPLDMRMNKNDLLTAAEILNNWTEQQISSVFHRYGEERWASRIAKFVVERRTREPFVRAGQLVETVKAAIPASARRKGGHPARRVFQGLRIAVNSELESLERGLEGALDLCAPGGVIVVISYHSLEDRIVKNVFRDRSVRCKCPPSLPICTCGGQQQVKLLTRKPIVPSEKEIESNPRARSARMRAVEMLTVTGEGGK